MLNIAVWNVRGLNKRDHQLALKDLVSEYRLHFLGILETRVRLNNVMHIQSFYFHIGNGLSIILLLIQFIHCRVTNMADNEAVIITVVYGASEVIDRRNLWTALETLSQQCSDIPWMVGGDFNAVRDLNEVCASQEILGWPPKNLILVFWRRG
ncbi:UNVERIFIED_CONTAM: hypothetical protein Sindi_0091900 [Sesamum indicum]